MMIRSDPTVHFQFFFVAAKITFSTRAAGVSNVNKVRMISRSNNFAVILFVTPSDF